MSRELQNRVSTLEHEVKSLRIALHDMVRVMSEKPAPVEEKNPNAPRQMCPKCGEVPNYHLHVRSCKGKKVTAQI
jgi:hypothetical protein